MTQTSIEPRGSNSALRRAASTLRPWLILGIVCGLFSLDRNFAHHFWTRDYLPSVLQQSARNIVLAVGMTFVILTAGIDLSVGAVLALSGVALAVSMAGTMPAWLCFLAVLPVTAGATRLAAGTCIRNARPPVRMAAFAALFLLIEGGLGSGACRALAGGVKMEGAICVALLVGVACGLINGTVISLGRVPSFVMTLGMLSAARGLTLYATDGSSIAAGVPRFMQLGQGTPLVGITLAVVILGSLLLTRTRAGRYILAIGGNEQAARLTGVPVGDIKTLAYILSGLAAAIGAVLVTAKFGLADTNSGSGAELDAIAAVVIGGTSLSGGQGSIIGALVGALTITVIEAGLVLVNAPDTLQPVILGAVIVLAVFVDQIRKRR